MKGHSIHGIARQGAVHSHVWAYVFSLLKPHAARAALIAWVLGERIHGVDWIFAPPPSALSSASKRITTAHRFILPIPPELITMTTDPLFDVIVVGAGVAGCSAAYHLQQAGVANMAILDAAPLAGEGLKPRQSGSATMPSAPCVKMMVQVFAASCDDFARHHGEEGATRYLNATREGLVLQKGIAKKIWKDEADNHMKQLGSYYLAYQEDEGQLKREFEFLQRLGCDQDGIEWCDKERLNSVAGISSKFYCGIYFPKEAAIDSSLYAKTLLEHVIRNSQGKSLFLPNSPVSDIQQSGDGTVSVPLQSGQTLFAKQVVVATGALHRHASLNGLLKPCYSYLVHVPTSTNSCQDSPNFFTWGFTHDWCYTNGKIRISGEDHFSAYKPPLLEQRCANLSKWTLEQYDCHVDEQGIASYPQQYGLYSETPDMAPLIGPLKSAPNVCYLLGCNAWGQAILSYCSSLVPGLLGYKDLTESQQDALELVSIGRFSELPNSR